jgi:DNA-binding transcriptional LysR family regulator
VGRDRLLEMEVFVRVADAGSFSVAARQTGQSQSQASKVLAALEARLDVRLVNRTTRGLTLTEAGRTFYDRCKEALAAIDRAESDAKSGQSAIAGTLTINSSALLGACLVAPAVIAMLREADDLKIALTSDDRRVDPVKEDIDLLVRIGTLDDSTLMVKRAGHLPFYLVATPAYLQARGKAPQTLSDIRAEEVLSSTNRPDGGAFTFLNRAGEKETLGRRNRLAVSNAPLAKAAVLGDAGIGLLPKCLAEEELSAGKLVRVLPDYRMASGEVNFLHAFGTSPPSKISRFMTFATEFWRREGYLMDRAE